MPDTIGNTHKTQHTDIETTSQSAAEHILGQLAVQKAPSGYSLNRLNAKKKHWDHNGLAPVSRVQDVVLIHK